MDEQDEFVKYVAGGIFRYGHAQRSSDVILWFAASGAFCIGSIDPQGRSAKAQEGDVRKPEQGDAPFQYAGSLFAALRQ